MTLRSAPRILMLLGAMLVLAACGTPVSPAASVQASATSEQPSQDAAVAVICALAPRPLDPNNIDLTGAWAGDDGGVYYLRQLGTVVWWNGMSGRDGNALDLGREWNNVGRGVINGLQIDVEWSDVPRGQYLNNGTMVLTIEDDGTGNIQIVVSGDTGDFGNNVWTPCEPVELQVTEYVRTYGGATSQYGIIMTLQACEDLADLESSVTIDLDTGDAGSPEWRAALGYHNAINERQSILDC